MTNSETIEKLINDTNLKDLVNSYGYDTLCTKKSTSKFPVLMNENKEKILLLKNNPLLMKNMNSSNEKFGNAINFIINHANGTFIEIRNPSKEDFKIAINTLKKFNNSENKTVPKIIVHQNTANSEKKKFNTKIESYKEINPNNIIETTYLTKRGINTNTIKHFKKSIYRIREFYEKKNIFIENTAFPLRDINNKLRGFTKRYFDRNNNSMKFNYGEISSNLWHSFILLNVKYNTIAVFESEIDAISHYQLKPSEETVYLSIGGNLNQNKINYIKELKNKININNTEIKVKLCLDNDFQGIIYILKLLKIKYEKTNTNIHILKTNDKPIFSFPLNNLEKIKEHLILKCTTKFKNRILLEFPLKNDFNEDLLIFISKNYQNNNKRTL